MVPLLVASRRLRRAWLPVAPPSLAILVDAVGVLAGLIVGAELLGLFSVMRWWTLALLFVAVGVASVALTRGRHPSAPGTLRHADPPHRRLSLGLAATASVVVFGQWTVLTADALGGGILSFDSLWYHLPFAAAFAQTGSVTHVVFTQADPFVAYYPANAELLNAVGLLALHNDFLAPLLNLGWLALGLLAAWCLGRPWRVEPLTLTAGCVVLSLPVLSATQPGSGFNDVAGLAALMAGVALIVCAEAQSGMLVVTGLALGLALGTKFTFAAPVVVLVLGRVWLAGPGRRVRDLALLGLPCLLTGGWWYLRALIDTGSPLGLRLHIGPLHVAGPSSPLANQLSQTVISALSKPHLWGERLAPGLNSAFGPVWPALVVLAVLGIIAGLVAPGRPIVRLLAGAGVVAALAYLVVPTGASEIEKDTQLFAVNLRYVTPAVALGLFAGVLVVAHRRPRWLPALGLLLLATVLATQFNRQLWPTQSARHAGFIVALAGAAAIVWGLVELGRRSGHAPAAAAITVVLVLGLGAGFLVQRHYFARRYVVAAMGVPPMGPIYHWALGVSHARVALYGILQQYPLYGARVTNRVTYLGQTTPDGGYEPIQSCSRWRDTLRRGRFQYLVLTPGPTSAVPPSWTQGDRAATPLIQPLPGSTVYKLDPSVAPGACTGIAAGA